MCVLEHLSMGCTVMGLPAVRRGALPLPPCPSVHPNCRLLWHAFGAHVAVAHVPPFTVPPCTVPPFLDTGSTTARFCFSFCIRSWQDAAVVLAAQSVPAVSKGLQKYWTESCNEADLDESALKVYQEVIRELTTIVDKMSSVAVAGGSDEPEIIMPSAGSQNATTNAVRSKEARLRKMMATASATSLAISRFRRKHKERQAAGSASSPASRVPSTPTSPPGDMVDCTNLLLPGVTETMARSALNTMAQQGLDMGLWADNSYLKVKLNVRPQERHLVVSRVGKKAGEPEELPMQHVGMVINGLPTDGVGGKRRRMSLARKPKPQRAVTVTDAKGYVYRIDRCGVVARRCCMSSMDGLRLVRSDGAFISEEI